MIKLFTHTDLDGVGCAILAKLVFEKDNVDVTYCDYKTIDHEVKKYLPSHDLYDRCIITDISVSDELASQIDSCFDEFFLFDHHPTALELNQYDWCHVIIKDEETGMKTCGAELFYNYLIDNGYTKGNRTIDFFVERVRSWDTWTWQNEGVNGIFSKHLNMIYSIYGRADFVDFVYDRITKEDALYFGDKERDCLVREEKKIERALAKAESKMVTVEVFGYTTGLTFCGNYTSEIGNSLSLKYPEYDFITLVDLTCQSLNFRTTKENLDLGKEIAARLGGGGHPKAAGAPITEDMVDDIIHILFHGDKKREKKFIPLIKGDYYGGKRIK